MIKQRLLNPDGRRGKTAMQLMLVFIVMFLGLSTKMAQQPSAATSDQEEVSNVAGTRFSIPVGFKLEQSSNSRLAFMRNPEISLFVAVADRPADEKYLLELSGVASSLLTQQQGFAWKIRPASDDRKVSRYQTASGSIKALNQTSYVQVDYVVLKLREQVLVVGSIGTYGEGLKSAYLFEHDGAGYSLLGWRGLFHLITSITGEKSEDQ